MSFRYVTDSIKRPKPKTTSKLPRIAEQAVVPASLSPKRGQSPVRLSPTSRSVPIPSGRPTYSGSAASSSFNNNNNTSYNENRTESFGSQSQRSYGVNSAAPSVAYDQRQSQTTFLRSYIRPVVRPFVSFFKVLNFSYFITSSLLNISTRASISAALPPRCCLQLHLCI